LSEVLVAVSDEDGRAKIFGVLSWALPALGLFMFVAIVNFVPISNKAVGMPRECRAIFAGVSMIFPAIFGVFFALKVRSRCSLSNNRTRDLDALIGMALSVVCIALGIMSILAGD